jgi:hypothetical protein
MTKDELEKILFGERTLVYTVLDGAAIPELRMKLYETEPPHHCLFPGELAPDMAEVAPYVVQLIPNAPFTDWVLQDFLGKNRGIFAHSPRSIREMRKHFRGLVKVYTESGEPMIFRFYDPRVIRRFLPTCNAGELKTFFGEVDTFFVENPGGQAVSSYRLEKNELKQVELN